MTHSLTRLLKEYVRCSRQMF